jgi:lysophospholipase L1-like esterase
MKKLTLEFGGPTPAVRSIEVRPAVPRTPTMYVAGDSTVTDQDSEPWSAWGQMLPVFFGTELAIANNAESGETIASFVSEKRFAKIFSVIKPGDYLLMQFGHNDQKQGKGYVPPDEYAELLKEYIALARRVGATPILVTPMNRRTFDPDGRVTNTLAPYPETEREVAETQKVPLVDLNAMSKVLYKAVGKRDSKKLFVYAEANTFPGQTEALQHYRYTCCEAALHHCAFTLRLYQGCAFCVRGPWASAGAIFLLCAGFRLVVYARSECFVSVDGRDAGARWERGQFRDDAGVHVRFVNRSGLGVRVGRCEENAVGFVSNYDGMIALVRLLSGEWRIWHQQASFACTHL